MKQGMENQNSRLLASKHALVTGGARGIGAAVTRVLLAHGARVTTLSRSCVNNTDDAAPGNTRETGHVVADVSDFEDVRRALEEARSRYGPIDILINNAGQAGSAPLSGV